MKLKTYTDQVTAKSHIKSHMEKCKDRTLIPRRTKLETIDHYAGIAVILLFGAFCGAGAWWLIITWPTL